MDYDLIVVKTLERVYKNYYYIIRGEFLLYIMLNIPIPAMIVNRCLLYVFVRVELRFPLYLPSTAVLGTAFAIFPICRLPLRYTCDHISFFSHL